MEGGWVSDHQRDTLQSRQQEPLYHISATGSPHAPPRTVLAAGCQRVPPITIRHGHTDADDRWSLGASSQETITLVLGMALAHGVTN